MPRYKVPFDQGLFVVFHKMIDELSDFYIPFQIHYNGKDVNGSTKDDEGRVKFSFESDERLRKYLIFYIHFKKYVI